MLMGNYFNYKKSPGRNDDDNGVKHRRCIFQFNLEDRFTQKTVSAMRASNCWQIQSENASSLLLIRQIQMCMLPHQDEQDCLVSLRTSMQCLTHDWTKINTTALHYMYYPNKHYIKDWFRSVLNFTSLCSAAIYNPIKLVYNGTLFIFRDLQRVIIFWNEWMWISLSVSDKDRSFCFPFWHDRLVAFEEA